MFHWICPECGREIPPSVRECQHCDPQLVEPVAAAPVLAATAAPAPTPEAHVPETPVAEAPVLETPHEPAPAPPPVFDLIPVALPAAERSLAAAPEHLPEPVAAAHAPVMPASDPPVHVLPHAAVEPLAVALPEPEAHPAALITAPPEPVEERPTLVLPAAEIALDPPALPVVEPILEAAPEPEAVAIPEPAVAVEPAAVEPVAMEAIEPAVVEAAEPAPPAVAEPEPEIKRQDVPDPLLALAEEIRAAQAARAAAPARKPAESVEAPAAESTTGLAQLAEAVEQHREPVTPEPAPQLHTETPVQAPEEAPVVSAIATEAEPQSSSAAAALAEQPAQEFGTLRMPAAVQPGPEPAPQALAAPEPEAEGPALPLAPMQKYVPATKKSIRPVSPPVKILGADIGPRITLPGPSLPPELTRLQDANPATQLSSDEPPKTAAAPGQPEQGSWFVTIAVAVLLAAVAGAAFYFLVMPRIVADAKPAAVPAESVSAPAPVKSTSPLGRLIEVTGFRIVVDSSKKSEVQYLVVNHSDADIADANVVVTLHAAKPGSPTVCRFSFKVPSLAPFEAKQMSSPIEKARTLSLPDWQDLRADVQISQ